MNIHSLLFLHPYEREVHLKGNPELCDMVSENYIVSGNEYFTERVPFKKEIVVESVQELCTSEKEKERVKYIMEVAMNKTCIDKDIRNAISNNGSLPSSVFDGMFNSLSSVLQQRYISSFSPKGQNMKNLEKTYIICDKIDDIRTLIELKESTKHHKTICEDIKILTDMMHSFTEDFYTHLVELKYQLLLKVAIESGDLEIIELVKGIRDLRDTGTISFEEAISRIRSGTNLKSYLEGVKNKKKNEIDIITVDEELIDVVKPSTYTTNFEIVPTVMSNLRGGVFPYDKLDTIIGKTKTLQLSPIDVFKYCSSKPGKTIERVVTTCGCREVSVAYDNLNVEIVLADVDNGNLLYVPLIRNLSITPGMEYLLGDNNMYTIDDVEVIRVTYRDRKGHDLDVLTEGIRFTEDGGVKLTYKPKSSYMDDYARINKIIVQNARNLNTEGMKTDLVFLFSFINELEKITKGKVKVKDSTMEDARKARMFAIGDFKQYLAFVQERDPSFNFSKYFEDNYKNEDKVMIEFTNKDIKGFRLLLRTILG